METELRREDVYEKILLDHALEPHSTGVWLYAGPHVARDIGWKLHVTATPANDEAVLVRAVRAITGTRAAFKVCRSPRVLRRINSGLLGLTQVGKFMTVYPEDDDAARSVAEALVQATWGFDGPAVPTDMHLGGAIYARFGGFHVVIKRDRMGLFHRVGTLGDRIVEDEYTVPFHPPEGVLCPFVATERVTQEEMLLDSRYAIVARLSDSPRGGAFLAVDVSKSETSLAVIKQARRFADMDEQGRDRRSALAREERRLRESLALGCHDTPRVLGSFADATAGYLVLEHVPGAHFGAAVREPWNKMSPDQRARTVEELVRLVDAVAEKHARGIVHRDLKETNIIVSDGRIVLLDWEGSFDERDGDKYSNLGTSGYCSPQQLSGDRPSAHDDEFAVGGILLASLSKLPPTQALWSDASGIASTLCTLFGVPFVLATAVARARHPEVDSRARLCELRAALCDARDHVSPETSTIGGDHCQPLASQAVMRAALDGILHQTAFDYSRGVWESFAFGDSRSSTTEDGFGVYRSAARGVAGVVYLLGRLWRAGIQAPAMRDRAVGAVEWLLRHEATPDDQLPGLHYGEAGVSVALAEAMTAGLVPPEERIRDAIFDGVSGELQWPDVTHGAAGQGLAALECFRLLNEERFREVASSCAAYLESAQEADGGWRLPPGREAASLKRPTGFAHGVAGIAYFLTECDRARVSDGARHSAERGVEWLLSRERRAGGVGWWRSERAAGSDGPLGATAERE